MAVKAASNGWILTPVFGAIAFVIFYVIATMLYPGGSEFDHSANGFSWMHNYWCNLLREKAINGQKNPGQLIGVAAFVVLGFTFLSFWYIFPHQLKFSKKGKKLMFGNGLLCCICFCFLTTSFHDYVINIGGFFGVLAMAGIYWSLYQQQWYQLFLFGVINVFLIAANNFIYYTKAEFYYLPLVQKVTFLTVLVWISAVDVKLYINAKKAVVVTDGKIF